MNSPVVSTGPPPAAPVRSADGSLSHQGAALARAAFMLPDTLSKHTALTTSLELGIAGILRDAVGPVESCAALVLTFSPVSRSGDIFLCDPNECINDGVKRPHVQKFSSQTTNICPGQRVAAFFLRGSADLLCVSALKAADVPTGPVLLGFLHEQESRGPGGIGNNPPGLPSSPAASSNLRTKRICALDGCDDAVVLYVKARVVATSRDGHCALVCPRQSSTCFVICVGHGRVAAGSCSGVPSNGGPTVLSPQRLVVGAIGTIGVSPKSRLATIEEPFVLPAATTTTATSAAASALAGTAAAGVPTKEAQGDSPIVAVRPPDGGTLLGSSIFAQETAKAVSGDAIPLSGPSQNESTASLSRSQQPLGTEEKLMPSRMDLLPPPQGASCFPASNSFSPDLAEPRGPATKIGSSFILTSDGDNKDNASLPNQQQREGVVGASDVVTQVKLEQTEDSTRGLLHSRLLAAMAMRSKLSTVRGPREWELRAEAPIGTWSVAGWVPSDLLFQPSLDVHVGYLLPGEGGARGGPHPIDCGRGFPTAIFGGGTLRVDLLAVWDLVSALDFAFLDDEGNDVTEEVVALGGRDRVWFARALVDEDDAAAEQAPSPAAPLEDTGAPRDAATNAVFLDSNVEARIGARWRLELPITSLAELDGIAVTLRISCIVAAGSFHHRKQHQGNESSREALVLTSRETWLRRGASSMKPTALPASVRYPSDSADDERVSSKRQTNHASSATTNNHSIPAGCCSSPSWLYWQRQYLLPCDRMDSGASEPFTDTGRSNVFLGGLPSAYDVISPSTGLTREVISVDLQDDKDLAKIVAISDDILHGVLDTHTRAQLLLGLVTSAMGGPNVDAEKAEEALVELRKELGSKGLLLSARHQRQQQQDAEARSPIVSKITGLPLLKAGDSVEEAFQGEVRDALRSSHALVSNKRQRAGAPGNRRLGLLTRHRRPADVVPLGAVKQGLCRHRALLYKFLCDRHGVPCYLIRGQYLPPPVVSSHGDLSPEGQSGTYNAEVNEEPEMHVWNVVATGRPHYTLRSSRASATDGQEGKCVDDGDAAGDVAGGDDDDDDGDDDGLSQGAADERGEGLFLADGTLEPMNLVPWKGAGRRRLFIGQSGGADSDKGFCVVTVLPRGGKYLFPKALRFSPWTAFDGATNTASGQALNPQTLFVCPRSHDAGTTASWESPAVVKPRVLGVLGAGATSLVLRVSLSGGIYAMKQAREKEDIALLKEEFRVLQLLSDLDEAPPEGHFASASSPSEDEEKTAGNLAVDDEVHRQGKKTDRARDCKHDNHNIIRAFGWSPATITATARGGIGGGIIMQYMPLSLLHFMNQLVTRKAHLSFKQRRQISLGVLNALVHTHAKGYVHRDVKPENVLLCIERCVSCVDYGLVCRHCNVSDVRLSDFADAIEVPLEGHLLAPPVGTQPYAAPEIDHHLRFSFSADMWSVGMLLLEMYEMRLPNSDGTNGGKWTQLPQLARAKVLVPDLDRVMALASAPTTPSDRKLSKAWGDLVRRCLDVTPNRRPTAQEALLVIDRDTAASLSHHHHHHPSR